MEPLPLRTVAWIFTAAGAFALSSGILAMRKLHKAGMLRDSNYSMSNDIVLMGIWSMGFFASLGILNYKPWALTLLEYFCWVLIALTGVSGYTRAMAMRENFRSQFPDEKFNWPPVIAGALLFFIPVTLLCAAALYTLRDEGVRKDYRAAVAATAAENRR